MDGDLDRVLIVMMVRPDNTSISSEELAHDMGTSPARVRHYLRLLEEKELIEISNAVEWSNDQEPPKYALTPKGDEYIVTNDLDSEMRSRIEDDI